MHALSDELAHEPVVWCRDLVGGVVNIIGGESSTLVVLAKLDHTEFPCRPAHECSVSDGALEYVSRPAKPGESPEMRRSSHYLPIGPVQVWYVSGVRAIGLRNIPCFSGYEACDMDEVCVRCPYTITPLSHRFKDNQGLHPQAGSEVRVHQGRLQPPSQKYNHQSRVWSDHSERPYTGSPVRWVSPYI